MRIQDILCSPVYFIANKLTSRCRNKKEREMIFNAARKHFGKIQESEQKAQEYERIMSEKDKLYEAVEAVKIESVETKNEMTELEMYIFQLEEDNETMQSLIALVCQLRANEEWERLDDVIRILSNQYLPS